MRLVSKDILRSEKGPEQSVREVLGERLATDAFQSARTGLWDFKRVFLEPGRTVPSAEVLNRHMNRHRRIRAQGIHRNDSIMEARIRRRSGNTPATFLEELRRELLVHPKDFGVEKADSSAHQLALVTPGTKP